MKKISNYVRIVKGTGTFVQEWQKKNGSFKGFKGLRAILCKMWQSKAKNDLVQIEDVEDENSKYNLPAGIFLGYKEEHPDSQLVLIDGETWTINPDVPFNYDPIEGITED
jgi:hypothetical protein